MDWLLRPVVEGCIQFESLKRTEIDLADIALLNDALDARAENRARIQEAGARG